MKRVICFFKYKAYRKALLFSLSIVFFQAVFGQVLKDSSITQNKVKFFAQFGKGVGIQSSEDGFSLNMNGRIQSLAEFKYNLDSIGGLHSDFLLRRCRLNLSGSAFNPKFTYRIQLGFASGDISSSNSQVQNNLILRDAIFYYQAQKWLIIGFGQTKLPGNRQRQISSGNLQLIERSIVNNNFTLDRDKGIWLISKFPIGKAILNSVLSISSGEGRINSDKNGSLCYSGRVELLPFGSFIERGEFIEADIQPEPTLKLSLGLVMSKNITATRTLGQLGEYLYNGETADIFYWGGDILIKKGGFSAEAEYYNRNSNSSIYINSNGQKNYVLEGQGFMVQSGLFISSKDEIAARYAVIEPDKKIKSLAPFQREIVIGYNHYFFKHNLKLQTDFSYMQTGYSKSIITRLSGVIAF